MKGGVICLFLMTLHSTSSAKHGSLLVSIFSNGQWSRPSRPSRPVRQSPTTYVLVNQKVFSYMPSQYGNWNNWTACSKKDCTQMRYRKCRDNSWKSRGVRRLSSMSCPVQYLMERRRCSDIPQCSLDSPTVPSNFSVLPETCGVRPTPVIQSASFQNKMIRNKIAGGRQSSKHSWPWQVALVFNDERYARGRETGLYFCGGTLISSQWVLTAAHCIKTWVDHSLPLGRPLEPWRYGLGNLVVRIGDHSRFTKDGPEKDVSISRFILHPKFRMSTFTNIYDVALIKLSTPIQNDTGIDYSCIPENTEDLLSDGTLCKAVGWGFVKSKKPTLHRPDSTIQWLLERLENLPSYYPNRNRRYNSRVKTKWGYQQQQPEHLMEVEVPLVNFYRCRKAYPELYIDRNIHVCAGATGKDTCGGDSGGGLFCKIPDTNKWQLYGITSFGTKQGCGNTLGVYARVSTVTNWARNIILNNGKVDQN